MESTENKIPLDDRPSATYTRKCSVCGINKTFDQFYLSKRGKDGIRTDCKECYKASKKTPEGREKQRSFNQKWRREDPRKQMYFSAKYRAKKENIPFEITVEDIFLPKTCPIFGVILKKGDGKITDNSPSLDRVKPELGYIPGNICVISYRANRIKSDLPVEDLEAVVHYIHSFDRVMLSSHSKMVNKENNIEPISQHRNSVG